MIPAKEASAPTDGQVPDPCAVSIGEFVVEEKSEGAGTDQTKKVAIVVFSGDMDKVWGAFNMATAAASEGDEVTMFFTFWGLQALRKTNKPAKGDGWMSKMFLWMFPPGPAKLGVSKMNMGGMGKWMMEEMMKRKRVLPIAKLMEHAEALGVNMYACNTSMAVLGLTKDDLIDNIEIRGVSDFLEAGRGSCMTLFVS